MLKDTLKSLLENIYQPQVDPEEYIQKFVSTDYIQIVDGHHINYSDFIAHIIKQRQVIKDVSFDFRYLIEENNYVASLHRIHATKIDTNKKIIAEVHAFFQFKEGILRSCNERTKVIQGSTEDEDLGRRK
ncbi:MAG: hypothetical protein B6I31_04450 [Desulfobacteraceae bacterium 4572_19]|nr:MAG: hypothetical protein B6I31_04450 [Desulfobacteraceae bacterium 4572_19]